MSTESSLASEIFIETQEYKTFIDRATNEIPLNQYNADILSHDINYIFDNNLVTPEFVEDKNEVPCKYCIFNGDIKCSMIDHIGLSDLTNCNVIPSLYYKSSLIDFSNPIYKEVIACIRYLNPSVLILEDSTFIPPVDSRRMDNVRISGTNIEFISGVNGMPGSINVIKFFSEIKFLICLEFGAQFSNSNGLLEDYNYRLENCILRYLELLGIKKYSVFLIKNTSNEVTYIMFYDTNSNNELIGSIIPELANTNLTVISYANINIRKLLIGLLFYLYQNKFDVANLNNRLRKK